jgi:hypothetical protein
VSYLDDLGSHADSFADVDYGGRRRCSPIAGCGLRVDVELCLHQGCRIANSLDEHLIGESQVTYTEQELTSRSSEP